MFNGNTFREEKNQKSLNRYKSETDIKKSQKKKILKDYLANRAIERRDDWIAQLPVKERTSTLIYIIFILLIM